MKIFGEIPDNLNDETHVEFLTYSNNIFGETSYDNCWENSMENNH